MAKLSAGILLYRRDPAGTTSLHVLLVHPGGPFWANKDLGAWTIPKGEPEPGEELLAAARREFAEETGGRADGDALALASITQAAGKTVHAWAVAGEFDAATLQSNTVMVEWPRGTGRMREFPEVDRGAWFSIAEARRRILPAQEPLLDRLLKIVGETV